MGDTSASYDLGAIATSSDAASDAASKATVALSDASDAKSAATAYLDQSVKQAASPTFAGLFIQSTDPAFYLVDTNAAADERVWGIHNNGGSFHIETVNDAWSSGHTVMGFARIGDDPYCVTFSYNVGFGGDANPAEVIDVTGNINVTGVYKVDDVQVVKEQQAHIADPTGGDIVDTEARSAITSILSMLQTHGLIASV